LQCDFALATCVGCSLVFVLLSHYFNLVVAAVVVVVVLVDLRTLLARTVSVFGLDHENHFSLRMSMARHESSWPLACSCKCVSAPAWLLAVLSMELFKLLLLLSLAVYRVSQLCDGICLS
jgi:hypothetical protein